MVIWDRRLMFFVPVAKKVVMTTQSLFHEMHYRGLFKYIEFLEGGIPARGILSRVQMHSWLDFTQV